MGSVSVESCGAELTVAGHPTSEGESGARAEEATLPGAAVEQSPTLPTPPAPGAVDGRPQGATEPPQPATGRRPRRIVRVVMAVAGALVLLATAAGAVLALDRASSRRWRLGKCDVRAVHLQPVRPDDHRRRRLPPR